MLCCASVMSGTGTHYRWQQQETGDALGEHAETHWWQLEINLVLPTGTLKGLRYWLGISQRLGLADPSYETSWLRSKSEASPVWFGYVHRSALDATLYTIRFRPPDFPASSPCQNPAGKGTSGTGTRRRASALHGHDKSSAGIGCDHAALLHTLDPPLLEIYRTEHFNSDKLTNGDASSWQFATLRSRVPVQCNASLLVTRE
jgi:hypothetical protein